MADGRVIPLDPDRAHGNRRKRRPANAADAVAAGAARASEERARRRATGSPLLAGADPATDDPPRPKPAPAARSAAGAVSSGRTKPRVKAAGDRTSKRPASAAKKESGPARVVEDRSAALDDAEPRRPAAWERRVAGLLAFARRRLTGDYEIDDFGHDRDLTDNVLMAALRPMYDKWFRVETRGLENVPDTGGALVVANHSGTIALDAVMTQLALLDHHPARRCLRMLGADLVFQTPFVGELARKSGSTLACNADAERLLGRGELVGVWPEGFKGVGKPFSDRYKLQRFGRGGFVAAALRQRTPIIPCAIVGAEEIYPMLGNAKTVARVLGLPYLPITPTFPWLGPLGLIPLPSKWVIAFGEPIDTANFGDNAADDPMLVFNLTDQVRETIQHTLYKLLMQRRSVFF